MAAYQPLGKFLLVKLHRVETSLVVVGEDAQYKSSAEVLAVGPEVDGPIVPGDVVLLNPNQGVIGHKELGEGVALVPAPLVLARQVGVIES